MEMDEELKKIKSVLRSLVVSSPVSINMRTLLRDYREMMGCPMPLGKFGYRDPLKFFQERCNDCFLFQGSSTNPDLILIVPDSLKHIDKFVQKQKVSTMTKFKGKRRSVLQSSITSNQAEKQNLGVSMKNDTHTKTSDNDNCSSRVPNVNSSQPVLLQNNPIPCDREQSTRLHHSPERHKTNQTFSSQDHDSGKHTSSSDTHSSGSQGQSSSKLTLSSGRSLKEALEEVKLEIKAIIDDHPETILCCNILDAYKARFGRELDFKRFGCTSIVALVSGVPGVALTSARGAWRAGPAPAAAAAAAPAACPAPRLPPPRPRPAPSALDVDADDALPGVEFEPDVFPEDCMQLGETIPELPLDGIQPGDNLEVMVGEVYSPSHFWLLRLGDDYLIALDQLMDEMTEYYSRGEGAARRLAVGAVRAGHYCAACFLGDWHRAVIVRILDADTVKVRHVDYGTVETVRADSLRALRRRWAGLAVQAVRARLAAVRPAARAWPRAAAAALLHAVRDTRLVAHVLARSPAPENILEVLLFDTSTEEDVCISSELITAGHAEPCAVPAPRSESYLYPKFEALESGATPNYAELHAYLRDGVRLHCLLDYRRHVPACLPSRTPSPPSAPSEPSESSAGRTSPCADDTSPSADDTSPSVDDTSPSADEIHPTDTNSNAILKFSTDSEPAPVLTPPILAPPTPRLLHSLNSSIRVPPLHRPAPPEPERYPALNPGSTYRPYQNSRPEPFLPVFQPSFGPVPFAPVYPAFPPPFPYPCPYPTMPYPQAGPPPSPAPPPAGPGAAVSIPASECEIFSTLSRVDPAAAQRYMLDAISRAMAAAPAAPTAPTASCARPRTSTLDPTAPPFRASPALHASNAPSAPSAPPAPPAALLPPPGFEEKLPYAPPR